MRAAAAAGWLKRRGRELAELGWRDGRAAGEHPAVPPRRLRARTGAPEVDEFALGGQRAAEELAGLLPQPIERYRAILDFGCGSGRVLPHVAALAPRARCAGCDVDADAIAWAGAHHPGLSFSLSRAEPPLPFSPGQFDLVYSISVLSHLDAAGQDAWMAELARILAPGGTALVSIHGPSAHERFRSGEVTTAWCPRDAFHRAPLGTDEFAFVAYGRSPWNRGDLPGVADRYGLAFHGHEYVREHWSRWFAVESVATRALTDWQDVAVLRRVAGRSRSS